MYEIYVGNSGQEQVNFDDMRSLIHLMPLVLMLRFLPARFPTKRMAVADDGCTPSSIRQNLDRPSQAL